jgi:large subunit ribosomal protein L17
MRHRKAGLKLNRTSSHRNAMFRNMVTSLFKHDRIRTTGPKAKEVRRWADHLITLAKRGDLHARRQALSIVQEKDVVHKLFDQAAERFGKISGGYTRVVKLGTRPGDSAPISLVELVAAKETPKKKTKKKTTKTAATKASAADKKDKAAVKTKKAVKKKADAPDAGDAVQAKAKSASKKKAAEADKEEAPAAEEAPDQKAAPEKAAAADEKDASDTEGPAESTEKSAKDE